MKIRFFNIKWDTTDDDNPQGQDIGLPSECTFNIDTVVDIDREGADILSDKYGWCVYCFDYEIK